MKKFGILILMIILISTIFVSGFQSKGDVEPNTVYEVYLDNKIIGRVKSKDALEDYIDKKGETYKKSKSNAFKNLFKSEKITMIGKEDSGFEKVFK